MGCYRAGGCGPNDYKSCHECIYSKPPKVEQVNISIMEQLEFAIDCLRGVCAACKHMGKSSESEPCSKGGEMPGFGLWEWKYAPNK